MSERAADKEADGVSAAPDGVPPVGSLSARDAAAVLGISERTVRRAIARGELAKTTNDVELLTGQAPLSLHQLFSQPLN